MAEKRNLPAHGYLGYYHGSNKTQIRKIIRSKFKIPTGSKIVINYYNSNVYECEVIVPTIRAALKKAVLR